MLPKSEELEALWGRAKKLSAELGRLKGAEVSRAGTKESLAAFAREWLRLSPAIRDAGICSAERLDHYDASMSDLLQSSNTRARASSLKRKLDSFADGALHDVVVPIIQFEGNPRQVAARQINEAFSGSLSEEEYSYVDEAARCVTVHCHRAAIIMLWAAAMARFHAAVVAAGFTAFNAAVDRIAPKKGAPFTKIKEAAKLTSVPELQRSRDADLLIIGMELFGYDLQVYQELERLLGTRNDAAHPGMARPTALDVQQFASKMRALVFDRVQVVVI
jgi:hypothetical protein